MELTTGSSAPLSGRHVLALDGLRGIAILIVMFHHFEFLLPAGDSAVNVFKNLLYMGWSGVDLFFVLSGFLITGILMDTRAAGNYFSSFYARRALRIFPLYYSVLGFIVLIANVFYQPWFDGTMALRADQIFYFFYLNNWMFLLRGTWHANIIGHFWSLAVEEQFYLVWPLCVRLIPPRHLLKVTLWGCVFAFLLRCGLVAAYGPSQAISQNLFARMDALLMGAACAVIVRNPSMIPRIKPFLVPILAAAAIGLLWIDLVCGELRTAGIYLETFGFSFLAMGYAALLLKVFLGQDTESIPQKALAGAPLRAIGKYSYGIYVLHVPILTVVFLLGRNALGLGVNVWTSTATFLALLVVSFLAAMVSYDVLEAPFLRLKFRFKPSLELASALPASALPARRA